MERLSVLVDRLLAILIRIKKHQEVERLYAEIMDKIGSDRLETSEDMIYCFSIKSNGFILETGGLSVGGMLAKLWDSGDKHPNNGWCDII